MVHTSRRQWHGTIVLVHSVVELDAFILLVLTHHAQGPPFLRALITVLRNCEDTDDDNPLIFTEGSAHQRRQVSAEEKMWSEKLNQNPAEVAHYWRQFGLNRECCIADLKRLSATMTPHRKGLLVFKDDFPVLFECLHAVFGLMMSNSRLCEQIHGMMRHSLKSSGPGMDQIDATLFYATGTDYVMRRERRDLLSGRQEGQPPKKKLKSLDHNKTKPQIVMLSEQLLEGASKWKGGSESILSQPNNGGIPTIKQIQLSGRRVQDKKNIQAQLDAVADKVSKMTREKITLESVKEEAAKTVPTNDSLLRLGDERLEMYEHGLMKCRECNIGRILVNIYRSTNYYTQHCMPSLAYGAW